MKTGTQREMWSKTCTGRRNRAVLIRILGVKLAVSLALACASAAQADATLEFTSRTGNSEPVKRTLIVKDGRIGFLTADGGKVHTIFDQAQSAFTFINHADRQYTVISAEWMREMQQRAKESMQRMQKQMDEQVKNMPPQQRNMYQQGRMMMPMMMPYLNNLAKPNQFRTAVPLYIKQTINGVQCQRVDLLEGGRKVQELCIAQRDQLKALAADDYQAILAMLKVAQEIDSLGGFAMGFKRPFIAAWGGGRPGLPVSVTEHSAGSVTVTQLDALRDDAVDAARLQLPDDYLQAKIPFPVR